MPLTQLAKAAGFDFAGAVVSRRDVISWDELEREARWWIREFDKRMGVMFEECFVLRWRAWRHGFCQSHESG